MFCCCEIHSSSNFVTAVSEYQQSLPRLLRSPEKGSHSIPLADVAACAPIRRPSEAGGACRRPLVADGAYRRPLVACVRPDGRRGRLDVRLDHA